MEENRKCSWGNVGSLVRSGLEPEEHGSLFLPMAPCRSFVSWGSEAHANVRLLTMLSCGEVKHNWNSRAALSKMTLKIPNFPPVTFPMSLNFKRFHLVYLLLSDAFQYFSLRMKEEAHLKSPTLTDVTSLTSMGH